MFLLRKASGLSFGWIWEVGCHEEKVKQGSNPSANWALHLSRLLLFPSSTLLPTESLIWVWSYRNSWSLLQRVFPARGDLELLITENYVLKDSSPLLPVAICCSIRTEFQEMDPLLFWVSGCWIAVSPFLLKAHSLRGTRCLLSIWPAGWGKTFFTTDDHQQPRLKKYGRQKNSFVFGKTWIYLVDQSLILEDGFS